MSQDVIMTGHGGGGKLARELLDDVIMPAVSNPVLDRRDDAAVLPSSDSRIAFTTDSYVIDPLFFPGGNIGTLAACGTINDLAMQGAEPLYLSLSLILEEGLPLDTLRSVLASFRKVMAEKEVMVATGDTKVVDRGGGGRGMYINTAGIGRLPEGVDVDVRNAQPGDAVIVTGPVGEHGIAVMAEREGLNFETPIQSDVAPLSALVKDLLAHHPQIRSLRDPTRGGLATALCDIAEGAGVGVVVNESAVPVSQAVRGACRLLGLDPMNAANEGRAVIVCAQGEAGEIVERIRSHPDGHEQAAVIGEITSEPAGKPIVRTEIGGERILPLPSGEELPRIC